MPISSTATTTQVRGYRSWSFILVAKGLCNSPVSDADSDAKPGPVGPVDCVVRSRDDPKDRLAGGFMMHKKEQFSP